MKQKPKYKQGYFTGEVESKWLREPGVPDRKMEILKDFTFIDKNGRSWTAPKGCVVDGASIPPWAQPIIGSPLVGDYRDASVIHDYYCQIETRPSKEVHSCFCEMIKVLGVGFFRRKAMCAAVHIGGPKFK